MPLTINGKVFMNIQEAVAWLLANNALPFQCKVNYVADTEIAKSNIINPSPAEIKIGSLVLFADGKVGTVSGITANGFMVGAESTDLSDGVPHIVGITIDASQHLIFSMSEGDPIDAGLVKMVTGFTIDASQHLIVHYNDGTTTDLGAIFQGNITISGDLTVTGAINGVASPSVKPIYYHPIYFVLEDGLGNHVGRMQCVILDNNPTAYTATTFVNKIKQLLDNWAIINVNGYYLVGGVYSSAYMISKESGSYLIFYYSASARSQVDFDTLTITTFVDGVNKIN